MGNPDNSTVVHNSSVRNDDTVGSEYVNAAFSPCARYSKIEKEKLRRKLKFFFLNPYEKWKVKRKLPWNLLLQLVKIVLVTSQLSIYGLIHTNYINFVAHNKVSLKHLFLKDWSPSYETMPYPPLTGLYALYHREAVYQHIDFVVNQYNNTRSSAIGHYRLSKNETSEMPVPVIMCRMLYSDSDVYENGSFVFNSRIDEDCFNLDLSMAKDSSVPFDAKSYLQDMNKTLDFDVLVKLSLKFSVQTVYLKSYSKCAPPSCFNFTVTVGLVFKPAGLYIPKKHK